MGWYIWYRGSCLNNSGLGLGTRRKATFIASQINGVEVQYRVDVISVEAHIFELRGGCAIDDQRGELVVGHCGLGEKCGGGEKTAELHVEMHFVP
jgi:hypothetical protein